jgi:hypothetical protein
MKTITWVLLLTLLSIIGCGGGENKMADQPSDEAVKKNEAATKAIDDEERGPAKKGSKR